MTDRIAGCLQVKTDEIGQVILDLPSITFSPNQARQFGLMMLRKAAEADGFPGSGEEGEYLINFNTEINPGKLQAVRVRIDLVTVHDMSRSMDIGLRDHPLYKELCEYVEANPR